MFSVDLTALEFIYSSGVAALAPGRKLAPSIGCADDR
jgi:hypothetical protein